MARVATEERKPEKVFFPVQRVMRGETAEKQPFRVVEGYAYVNAWVGDGINLTRSAMVAASDDYMRWGAVREMHQPSAVGTAIGSVEVDGETLSLGVVWDDTGAFLRSMIVDADAIAKLDTGVYRGYSVCVVPTIMRGIDCEACKWIENSLVDRPADSDCPLTLIRADGVDVNAPQPVMRYWDDNDNWIEGPYLFDDRTEQLRNDQVTEGLYGAFYMLIDSWRGLLKAKRYSDLGTSLDQFTAFCHGDILREINAERAEQVSGSVERLLANRDAGTQEATMLTRVQEGQTEAVRLRGELQRVEGELSNVTAERNTAQSEVTTLRADVERLGKQPDPAQTKPVKFDPATRTITGTDNDPLGQPTGNDEIARLKAEFATLERTLKDEPDEAKRREGVVRMGRIKQAVADLGGQV